MMNVLSPLFQGPPIIVSYSPNSKVIAGQSIQCSALIHAAAYGGINTEVMIPFVNGQELTLHEISSTTKERHGVIARRRMEQKAGSKFL